MEKVLCYICGKKNVSCSDMELYSKSQNKEKVANLPPRRSFALHSILVDDLFGYDRGDGVFPS
jgi:hypothetical protein